MMKDSQFTEAIYEIMSAADWVLAQGPDGGGYSVDNGVPYKNEVFETFPFQWEYIHEYGGECGCPGECPDEKPNFRHFASGLEVSWYKCIGRDTISNKSMKSLDWYRIVVECLESLKRDAEEFK